MTADLTISVLSEKLSLKQAMRIHFAGQAMAAFIETQRYINPGEFGKLATYSVCMADALIAELEKTEGGK